MFSVPSWNCLWIEYFIEIGDGYMSKLPLSCFKFILKTLRLCNLFVHIRFEILPRTNLIFKSHLPLFFLFWKIWIYLYCKSNYKTDEWDWKHSKCISTLTSADIRKEQIKSKLFTWLLIFKFPYFQSHQMDYTSCDCQYYEW